MAKRENPIHKKYNFLVSFAARYGPGTKFWPVIWNFQNMSSERKSVPFSFLAPFSLMICRMFGVQSATWNRRWKALCWWLWSTKCEWLVNSWMFRFDVTYMWEKCFSLIFVQFFCHLHPDPFLTDAKFFTLHPIFQTLFSLQKSG